MHELWNSFEFDYEGFKDEDFPGFLTVLCVVFF